MKMTITTGKLLLLFMLASVAVSAQKKEKLEVDYDGKTGIATVSGAPWCKVEKETVQLSTTYTVQNLEGNPLIVFKPVYYKDSREISQSNPDGKQSYFDIIILDAPDIKVDWTPTIGKPVPQMVAMLYKHKVIVDGKIDVEAAKMFARIQGTVNTEKRRDAW